MTENNFEKDVSMILDEIVNIVKGASGKISIKVKQKPAVAFDFEGDKLSVDIIDPTIFNITEQENIDIGIFEKLKTARKLGEILNNKGMSISILRKGKRALSIGREATPTISSFITGSDDIQIDSVRQVAKLDRDLKKANQN
ncbi:MAG: hypothetical protein QOK86_08390, partial [Nitrososphaeraceae archaeon]|nr:hypothetical protein [Nitrososphaeraceae archaeon]